MRTWEIEVDRDSKSRANFCDSGEVLPPCYNVDIRRIKEGKDIGQGQWEPVLDAEWCGKMVPLKKFNGTSPKILTMSKEVARMINLQHPNVLKPLAFSFLAQEDLVLKGTMVMELIDCDLDTYVEKRRGVQNEDRGGFPMSIAEKVHIIFEIANGMNHMHNRGFFIGISNPTTF